MDDLVALIDDVKIEIEEPNLINVATLAAVSHTTLASWAANREDGQDVASNAKNGAADCLARAAARDGGRSSARGQSRVLHWSRSGREGHGEDGEDGGELHFGCVPVCPVWRPVWRLFSC